jgi:hypothetical protein
MSNIPAQSIRGDTKYKEEGVETIVLKLLL